MIICYINIMDIESMLFVKVFYILFGLVGVAFSYWSASWYVSSDSKHIVSHTMIRPTREVEYGDILKVEVIKKKKIEDMIVSYNLIDKKGVIFASVYPNMRNCGELLVRLKRIGVPVEETYRK